MKNLNFAECCYECLDLLPIYIWMFNNWSAPKTCGWLLKILWDWEEFEVAWIIIKGLLARSWDVTTDFFTTQFSVFEGGWPKRITISLLLTKPIFILLFNEIVSHVLQHDTKSWKSDFEKDGWRTPSKLILMSDFGGNKAGKVDGGPARCIGPCTYIVEPLLERPLFYQVAGEKTLILAMCILWILKFREYLSF